MAATTNTITEASKMLEAALQQMDGIISGTNNNSNNNLISSSPTPSSRKEHSPSMQIEFQNPSVTSEGVLLTAKTLAMILQQIDLNTPPPDSITASIICEWLERHQLIIYKKICDTNKVNNNNTTNDINNGNTNENIFNENNIDRFKRFQYDKEAMIKEYQLMMDKVSMQSHKIIELEGLLAEKTQQMSIMEEQLQRHICTRSELETQKLELITALSELKLHRATIERENYAMKNIELQQHLSGNDTNNTNSNHLQDINGNASKINTLISTSSIINNNNDSNDIVDLRKILCEDSSMKPKTPPASVRHKLQTHFHSLPRSHCLKISKPKLPWTAMMLGQTTGSNNHNNNNNNIAYKQQPNENNMDDNRQQRFLDEKLQQKQLRRTAQQLNNNSNYNKNNSVTDLLMYNSYTEQQQQPKLSAIKSITPKSPMNQPLSPLSNNLRERSKKSICHLLGKLRRSNSGQLDLMNMNMTEENERLAEFRRGDRARLTAGGRIEWSTADNRNDIDDDFNDQQDSDNYDIIQKTKPWSEWNTQDVYRWLNNLNLNCYIDDCSKWLKNNPLLSFFTTPIDDILDALNVKMLLHRKKIRLARDELMNMEADRLTCKASQLDVNWVMRWLDDIGLPQYKDTFYLHRIDGRLLHRLTMDELLVELKINSSLHVASLRRGIQCMREMEWNPECLIRRSSCGSYNKQENRNSADILTMSMNGEQHLVTSTPTSRNYNTLRQFDDGDNNNNNNNNINININHNEDNHADNVVNNNDNRNDNGEAGINYDDNTYESELANAGPETISLWTAHRVMEWLRAVDLSEYAPNLRGAGVHGSLMLYENRFNANLLADLLSIPSSKTLLRRHLATHFKELLGRDIIQRKREAETIAGYQPLTITAKLKPPKTKRTQFSLKKRAKSIAKNTNHEGDWIEYVCPMESLGNESNELSTGYQQHNNSTTSSSSTNISTTLNNAAILQ